MKHPKSLKDALRRLRMDGWTYAKLSELSGLDARTIQRWCNKQSANRCQDHKNQWYRCRREHCRQVARDYYWRDPDKNRKRTKEWVKKNRDHISRYAKEYRKRNPSACRLHESIRRARKKAVPGPHSLIERLMIKYLYEDARRITKETGIKHEVDHVIPLSKGGPHLPWNLKVITATANREKYNKV